MNCRTDKQTDSGDFIGPPSYIQIQIVLLREIGKKLFMLHAFYFLVYILIFVSTM